MESIVLSLRLFYQLPFVDNFPEEHYKFRYRVQVTLQVQGVRCMDSMDEFPLLRFVGYLLVIVSYFNSCLCTYFTGQVLNVISRATVEAIKADSCKDRCGIGYARMG